ncbi:MAG: hypothetical protein KAH22_06505 [Thiotrichaceae bacterium]|nr:hypothetical protein [Thiotrichaceae bacterium]
MITKLQSIKEIPHSAKTLFTLGLLIIALIPIQQLINNTQHPLITGVVWLLSGMLLISSFHSQRLSKQPIKLQAIIVLVGIAAVMQSIDQIFKIPVLSMYSFAFDLYAIALLLRVKTRQLSLSIHWLIVLYLFSIPEWGLASLLRYTLELSSTQLSWLLGTAILFTSSMAIIRPSRQISIVFIVLFLVSCVISHWLNNTVSIAMISLVSMLISLIIGKRYYQPPKKPHPFNDTTAWVIPKSIKNDGWWIEEDDTQKTQRQLTLLSLAFLGYAVFITLY